ncbi:MAG: hypothetical protein ACP5N9_05480 [Candidatus Bilamarchaeum sp.]
MHYRQLVEKYILDDDNIQSSTEAKASEVKTFEKAHANNETETELSNIEKIENALENEDYREVENGLDALRQIEDTFWLEYFAATSENKQAREIAIEMLENKERSLRAITMASEFADTRNEALVKLGSMLDQINDPATRALVAKNHPNKDKRISAIKSISDNSLITDVIKTSKYEDSRWEGVKKLRGNGTNVATEYLDRKYSLINLFDAVLENENTQSTDLILQNLDAIKGVLKDKNEGEVSESANKALGFYKEVLACIAARSKNAKSRQAALEALDGDYKKLRMVATSSGYRDSADAAIEKLGSMLSTINDNETLALIANHSSDEQLRRSAIAKINDPATLKELAKFSRKQEIRNIAIDKISHLSDDESAEIISKIAKEKRSGIKQRAKKKKIVIQQNHVRVTKEEFAQKQQEVADEPEVVEKPPKVSGLNEIIRAFRDLIGI